MVRECTDVLTLQEVGEWADRFENQELCNVVEHVFQRALSIFADRYAWMRSPWLHSQMALPELHGQMILLAGKKEDKRARARPGSS